MTKETGFVLLVVLALFVIHDTILILGLRFLVSQLVEGVLENYFQHKKEFMKTILKEDDDGGRLAKRRR